MREEARSTTSSFDIIKTIRVRRLRWLGQILRGDQDRLLFQVMKSQYEIQNDDNMFMDAPYPYHENFEDLITLANDKAFWKSQESNIP